MEEKEEAGGGGGEEGGRGSRKRREERWKEREEDFKLVLVRRRLPTFNTAPIRRGCVCARVCEELD